MGIEGFDQFIANLIDICRLSSAVSWQVSLQQALALFADASQAQDAALFLLDDVQSPTRCLDRASAVAPGLCATLQQYASVWQDIFTQQTNYTIELPGQSKPLWFVPIPSQSEKPRAVLALAGVDGTPPQFISDQGSALLTPLVHNALLSREVEAARATRPVNSIIYHRQQRQQYLESLYALIFTINSATDLDDILRTGLDEALQITETARGSIYLPNRSGTFTLRIFQGFDVDNMDDTAIIPTGLTRAVAEKRMIIERHPSLTGSHTEIYLPLIVEDQIVGLMNLIALQEHDITPEAAQLLVAIADQLALAVQRGQLTDKMREQLQTVQYLYEVSTAFLSQMVTSDIIFLLLRALTDTVVGSIGAAFYQFKNETWTRARVYATRNPEVRMHWKEGVPWDGEIEFLTTCQQERLLVVAGSDRHLAAPFWEHVEAVGAKQLLYLPLFLPNHNFTGAVIALMDEERTLTANESILAWAVIQQGTAALVRIGLYESSRQSESLMRAILESSRDGIILVGPDLPESSIRYINGKALQMLAIRGDATVWEGQTLSEVIAAIRENTPEMSEWLQDLSLIHI